ncbi:MAG TPA: type II secretion system protein GspE, partial [Actinobacteria bacterium]|nr:type II secretion system protein GspE [Actinomycetota bacterium]
MVRVKKRLGKILIEAGLITEEQLQQALESQDGKTLGRTLVDLGFITEADIAATLAKRMNLPFVDVGNYEINPSAATIISEDMARRYTILPIDFEGEKLVVAMADPANIFAIDDLRIVTGYDIKPVVATESDLLAAIN